MPDTLKFKYAQKVVDTLTKYRGRITGFCFYFGHRPNQYLVESIDSTGRPIETWVEEERLEAD